MVMRKGAGGSCRVVDANRQELDEHLFVGTLGVNCLEYTKQCIETFQSAAKQVTFLYVDNGSTGETIEQLEAYRCANPDIDDFQMVFNGYNAGVAKGWNQIVHAALEAGATKILICNNDAVFGPDTVDGLIKAYNTLREHKPETVMVTAANRTKNPNELPKIKREWKFNEHPDFSCFMITPETIERVGEFDERYDPAYFEDNDFHWRILMQGYKAFSTDWAPYSHIASRTRYGNPDIVPHATFRQNKIRFFQKMVTTECDQEIADARYDLWIKDHPDEPHPSLEDVMEYARSTGLIDERFEEQVNKLTIHHVS